MTDSPGMPIVHPELAPRVEEPPAEAPPPAPTPEAAPPEQAPPPGTPPASEGQGLIFGKYRNLEEAERGYFEQVNSFVREQAKAQAFESVLQQRAYPAPPQPAQPDPILEELENSGIPPAALERFVERVAQRTATNVYREQAAPYEAGQQARMQAAKRLPDFESREQAVADFIQADPALDARYRRMFQADPLAAMEWAYLSHNLATAPPAPPVRQSAAPPVAPAALPQAAAGARQVPQAADAGEMEAARQYALTYGDSKPWLRLRLRGILPEGTT